MNKFGFNLNEDNEVEYIGRVVAMTWDTVTISAFSPFSLYELGEFEDTGSLYVVPRGRTHFYPNESVMMEAAWPYMPRINNSRHELD